MYGDNINMASIETIFNEAINNNEGITFTIQNETDNEPNIPSVDQWPELLNDDFIISGNWSDFNRDYKQWLFLKRLSDQFGERQDFYQPEDIPEKPDPSDYPNLDQ